MEIKYASATGERPDPHPAAGIFPLIGSDELRELLTDIRENGMLEPIVMQEGMILDGRNRYICARELEIDYPYVEFEDGDPDDFVFSKNVTRRHLTQNQRALVCSKLSDRKRGRPAKLQPEGELNSSIEPINEKPGTGITTAEAAEKLQVSEASVKRAKKLTSDGVPELVEAVEKDEVSLTAAAEVADLPKEEQEEVVAKGDKKILAKAKEIRSKKKEENRKRKQELIAATAAEGAKNTAAGMPKGFPVVYADPPWLNKVWGQETGNDKSPRYPTMELEDIMALCAGDNSPATEDAVLYLWCTANRNHHGLKVMEAWGFEYKSQIVWDKEKMGMGRWVRDQHEILLIGTRGKFPAPDPEKLPRSLYREAKTEHSRKPDYFARMICGLFPNIPRLELFGQVKSEGWEIWSNPTECQ